jgi:hypothetical protein
MSDAGAVGIRLSHHQADGRIKAGKQRSLVEVRPEIEDELKRQAASRQFAEAAEAFSNMVYEQPDSLQPAADRFKLKIQQSAGCRATQPRNCCATWASLATRRFWRAVSPMTR